MESGTKLGHYEISTLLGKGGMGEVWRARDTNLGREVAIKTLPEEFAKDSDRLAQFEREAQLTRIPTERKLLRPAQLALQILDSLPGQLIIIQEFQHLNFGENESTCINTRFV